VKDLSGENIGKLEGLLLQIAISGFPADILEGRNFDLLEKSRRHQLKSVTSCIHDIFQLWVSNLI
jgi:hypothetical protein